MRMNPLPVGRDAVSIVWGAVEAGQGAGEGGQVLLNKAPETCQDRQIAITLQRQNAEISKHIFPENRNIGVSVPISTFMRLWVIYIFPRSVCLFCWRKYVDRCWYYMHRSQTHECGNWGWGRAFTRKGIHKWDFRCSAECWTVWTIWQIIELAEGCWDGMAKRRMEGRDGLKGGQETDGQTWSGLPVWWRDGRVQGEYTVQNKQEVGQTRVWMNLGIQAEGRLEEERKDGGGVDWGTDREG